MLAMLLLPLLASFAAAAPAASLCATSCAASNVKFNFNGLAPNITMSGKLAYLAIGYVTLHGQT